MPTFDEIWDSTPTQGAAPQASFDALWDSTPAPRTWGDTFTDLTRSAAGGFSDLVGTITDLNPFNPNAGQHYSSLGSKLIDYFSGNKHETNISDLQSAESNISQYLPKIEVNTSQMSTPERYANAAAKFAPTALLGGGLSSALLAGAGGEAAKDLGVPEWAGQLIGGVTPGLARSALETGAGALKKIGQGLENSAYGAQGSDFVKSLKTRGVQGVGEDASSSLANAIKTVTQEGLPSGANDYGSLLSKINESIDGLYSKITPLINAVDEAKGGIKVFPKYKNTLDFIESQPAAERQSLRNAFNEIKAAQRKELNGSIASLQAEKQGLYSKVYGENKDAKETLQKYIARDLKETIEAATDSILPPKQAGLVRATNARIANYEQVKPVVRRALGRSEGTDLGNQIRSFIRTSGGYGAPTIALTSALGPAGLIAGPAIGYGIDKLLFTPGGKFLSSKLAKNSAGILKGASELLPSKLGGLSSALIGKISGDNSQRKPASSLSSLISEQGRTMDQPKQALEAPQIVSAKRVSLEDNKEKILNAVRKVESNDGKALLSPAGAKGEYQFMPATAKAYGVDLNDGNSADDREGAWKLINDEYNRFGSLELALAAYNAGSPRITQAIKRAGSKDWPKVQAALRQMGLDETADYVTKYQKLGVLET